MIKNELEKSKIRVVFAGNGNVTIQVNNERKDYNFTGGGFGVAEVGLIFNGLVELDDTRYKHTVHTYVGELEIESEILYLKGVNTELTSDLEKTKGKLRSVGYDISKLWKKDKTLRVFLDDKIAAIQKKLEGIYKDNGHDDEDDDNDSLNQDDPSGF